MYREDTRLGLPTFNIWVPVSRVVEAPEIRLHDDTAVTALLRVRDDRGYPTRFVGRPFIYSLAAVFGFDRRDMVFRNQTAGFYCGPLAKVPGVPGMCAVQRKDSVISDLTPEQYVQESFTGAVVATVVGVGAAALGGWIFKSSINSNE